MSLTLTAKLETTLPIVAECLSPDRLEGLKPEEIGRLELLHGNQRVPLAELFDIAGDAEDCKLTLRGELSTVHHLGAGMQRGEMRIEGNVGRHLGSRMEGGSIEVLGSAGDWLGAEMQGGEIKVNGDGGDYAGSAYIGSLRGMSGGTLLINGNAGNEVGRQMRRGMLAVGGKVGDLFGANMLAGTLIACGACGKHPGAGMKRGTIVLLSSQPADLLPSFSHACRTRPVAIELLARELRHRNFSADAWNPGEFDLFRGDMLEFGKGEILFQIG